MTADIIKIYKSSVEEMEVKVEDAYYKVEQNGKQKNKKDEKIKESALEIQCLNNKVSKRGEERKWKGEKLPTK